MPLTGFDPTCLHKLQMTPPTAEAGITYTTNPMILASIYRGANIISIAEGVKLTSIYRGTITKWEATGDEIISLAKEVESVSVVSLERSGKDIPPTEQVVNELMGRKPKAGIYVRVSTQRQGQEGTSLDTQEANCLQRAISEGYEVLSIHIWRETESGAFLSRPEMDKMLEAVKNREVDKMYVYDHDRLARDPVDTLNIVRLFTDLGVLLEFLNGPNDVSPLGMLVMHLYAWAAQQERLKIMERTMRGKEETARKGRMPMGAARGRYGYHYDPQTKTWSMIEDEARIVCLMFQRKLEGKSGYAIAEELHAMGIRKREGTVWQGSDVHRNLRNLGFTGSQYYGRFRYEKLEGGKRKKTPRPPEEWILVEGFLPRIIEPPVFLRVQRILDTQPSRRRKSDVAYLLTGFAECAKCGKAVVGSMLLSGKCYYRCHAAQRRKEVRICNERGIRLDRLEPAVWKLFTEAVRNPEVLAQEYRQDRSESRENVAEEKRTLAKDVKNLTEEEERVKEMRQVGMITLDEAQKRIAPIKLQREDRERMLWELEEQEKRKEDAQEAGNRLAEFCRVVAEGLEGLTDIDEKRAAMAAFGLRVKVSRQELTVIITVDPSAMINGSSSA